MAKATNKGKKKSLLDTKEPLDKRPLREQVLSFEFRGREFREKISPELVLKDLSVLEIKEKLNDLPGRFAYWKSMLEAVEIEIERQQEMYSKWHAQKYAEVSENAEGGKNKPTETALKNRIILENEEEYAEFSDSIRELKEIRGQLKSIVDACNMQSWTLRAVESLTTAELSNLEPKAKGRGRLGDEQEGQ